MPNDDATTTGAVDTCEVCHKTAKHRVGLPANRVSLCGVHLNQLRRRMPPLTMLGMMTRREIRTMFGFINP